MTSKRGSEEWKKNISEGNKLSFKKGRIAWHKGKNSKIKRICKKCGEEFHVYPSVIKRGFGHYCSRKCKDSDMNLRRRVGSSLKVLYKNKENHPWFGKKKPFIPRPKARKRIRKLCKNCGSEFVTLKSKASRPFCCMTCRNTYYKKSNFHKGSDNPMYGIKAPKGSGWGKYSYCKKGHIVRSSWEKTIADWLFYNNIDYEYEFKRFLFEQITYVPDFYLQKFDLWIEAKGFWSDEAKKKVEFFRNMHHNLLVIDKSNFNNFGDEIIAKMHLSEAKV